MTLFADFLLSLLSDSVHDQNCEDLGANRWILLCMLIRFTDINVIKVSRDVFVLRRALKTSGCGQLRYRN